MPEGQEKKEAPKIMTMRDDLTSSKPPIKYPSAPVPPKLPVDKQVATQPQGPIAPLPVPEAMPIRVPPKKKKRSSKTFVILLIVVLILIAIGGASAWLFFFQSPTTNETATPTPISGEPLSIAQVIPGNVAIVAHYTFKNDVDRSTMLAAWKKNNPGPATTRGFLEGNPTLLLEETSTDEFAYVLLPGEPRMYAVVPNSQDISNILAGRSNVQSQDIGGGWLILHQFNTAPYVEQLAQSPRDTLSSSSDSLSITLAGTFIETLPSEFKNALGARESVTFGITPDDVSGVVGFRENPFLPSAGSPETQVAINKVLTALPADASKAVIGPNFSIYSSEASNPADQQQITEFAVPFGYFESSGGDGLTDTGLVLVLTPEIAGTLTIGDPALERILPLFAAHAGATVPEGTLAYTDGVYQEVPLRYVNIDRLAQLAIDYAIVDNYLLIATSREGMFSLIDTVRSQTKPLKQSDDWSAVSTGASGAAQFGDVFLEKMGNQTLLGLLPVPAGSGEVPFWATLQQTNNATTIRGQIKL